MPFIGGLIASATGVALTGLLYPMGVAALGVVVSLIGLREQTHKMEIWNEVGGESGSA